MREDTKIVTAGRDPESNHGVVNPPVYHASTILYPGMAGIKSMWEARARDEKGVYYGRIGHPTSAALEGLVVAVEGGYRCLLYPSGAAAITASILSVLKAGDHFLVTDSAYYPTRNFCNGTLTRFGVDVTYYDPLIGAGISDLMRPNTRAVFVESPGSQTFEVQDIPAIAEAAHKNDAKVLMDNTWASPLFYKPFEHGVDISIQAGTKYIVGHSDAMIGTATATKDAWPSLRDTTVELGQTAGPDDVYLAQRGMRTLSVRMKHQQDSALKLAEWFQTRSEVERVLYPPLKSDPGHALWKRDFTGAAALFGVLIKPCSEAAVAAFVDDLKLFGLGASWGGYESLILPQKPVRTAVLWDSECQLLRFHIGLEDIEDLKDDLKDAFDRLNAASS